MSGSYRTDLSGTRYGFDTLAGLLAAASPARSGDELAGVAAKTAQERIAAQIILADLPLAEFTKQAVIPYEDDEVTRLIVDSHDDAAFAPISHLTVGEFREWLLGNETDGEAITRAAPGITPEMAAAVSKIMRNQDLVAAARKIRVVTAFRTTIGLPGRFSVRLQPNHPTDDPAGISASILDGLLMGVGDAVIGINPATDSIGQTRDLLLLLDDIRQRLGMPVQSCVLSHVTNTIELIEGGAPVDIAFQSVGGTEATNRGFGIDLAVLAEAHQAALSLGRGTVGDNVMYFETGKRSLRRQDFRR